ncbi:MAG TPA: ABC transporter substrate-binding protein [Xanthobacteraceae bacterium]|nr:ABC transporter substrate-binding protein [Xanthobacteraceae bacterium]
MVMGRWSRKALAALAGAAMALTAQAKAETVTVGLVGAVSSTHWPIYIGLAKGYFAAESLTPDLVFIQSSAALVQQLTAGSIDLALSTGLADPIRAIDKGSPIGIVRIEMQAPPYALLAKPSIKRWPELKGKTISIGGPKDITRIYLERMAVPNGLKAGDYDTVFAGATSARFSALQAGAVDAAILLPPFNFYAESAGFTNLGLTIDYAKELPFTGTVVGRAWASARKATLDKVLLVNSKSMAWFSDPANRAEAIRIMVEASKLKEEDVAKSYDFLHKNEFFENTGRISKTRMGALLNALKSLGDIEGPTNIERFVLPGVAQLTD